MIVILFAICFFNCTAQKEGNIWCFGDSAGIDFNGVNPLPLTDIILNAFEPSSSISDSNGNLLFYMGPKILYSFDNYTVFNKLHQVMSNGDIPNGNYSATQGALILPFPSSPNMYYLFSIGLDTYNQYNLTYNAVDMTLNLGLGGVQNLNVILADTITEKMVAVRHGNGRDWWVIVHRKDTDEFIKFLITPNGVSDQIIQNIGGVMNYLNEYGQMVISDDGKKICIAASSGYLGLFDFDRCTGNISNERSFGYQNIANINQNYFYGISFSPNGNVIYASITDSLFQYDLTANNISLSKQLLWTIPNSSYHIGQHKLAPDGRIYIADSYGTSMPNNLYNTANMYLSVINTPDSLGNSCNFTPFSFYLGGKRCYYGLPNNPNYKLGALFDSPCDTLSSTNEILKESGGVSIFPSPNNGTFTLQYNLSAAGSLRVTDVLGREVYAYSLLNRSGQETISLPLSQGIYFWQVLQEHSVSAKGKLVIIK